MLHVSTSVLKSPISNVRWLAGIDLNSCPIDSKKASLVASLSQFVGVYATMMDAGMVPLSSNTARRSEFMRWLERAQRKCVNV